MKQLFSFCIVLILATGPALAGQDHRPPETTHPDLSRVNAVLTYLSDHRERGSVKVDSWYLLEEAGTWEHSSERVVVPFVGAQPGHPRRRHLDVTFELKSDERGGVRVVKARVTRVHRPLPQTHVI